MTDLQAYIVRADGPKKQRLSEQWHDAVNYHTIICGCGLLRAIEMAFRCLYCGEWYCVNCAEVHFGKTVQEHVRKDHERLRTLRNLMGSIQGATDTTVKLFQDDSTFTYHVTAGKESYWGESLNIAIDKATAAAIASAAKEDKHD